MATYFSPLGGALTEFGKICLGLQDSHESVLENRGQTRCKVHFTHMSDSRHAVFNLNLSLLFQY